MKKQDLMYYIGVLSSGITFLYFMSGEIKELKEKNPRSSNQFKGAIQLYRRPELYKLQ